MLITCPYCGERDSGEFTCLGEAPVPRPDPQAPDAPDRFHEAVHLRDNPAGPHEELWFHAAGCHAWLRVDRDTRTHRIAATRLAREE